MDPIEELLAELTANGAKWPPPAEVRVRSHVSTMRALLENDRDRLRKIAGWPADRPYKIDPVAGLIADAWADHLWGEDPTITPSAEADAALLELLLEAGGDFTGELHSAERTVVGEGEAWWRVYVDRDVADVPLLEWHGRDAVVPFYIGRRLMAVALVTELERRRGTVWRHLEVHADGVVEHHLYRGTAGKLGPERPLADRVELADLADAVGDAQAWEHGLPMLMGRITNGRRRKRALGELGVSDLDAILDDLLSINESKAIGHENMRLTAKRRVVVPEGSLTPSSGEAPFTGPLTDRGDGVLVPTNGAGTFDAGEDVLVTSNLDAELGRSADGTFKVLEYTFDAEPLIAWKRDLLESALTRIGLTPQYVGTVTGQGDGFALSGTALRLRLIPTMRAGRGKARPWDDALPRIVALMAQVDALPDAEGGFGRTWADPATPPAIERHVEVPHDPVEDASTETALVNARIRSRWQAVVSQHPDWTDEQVQEELDRITADAPAPAVAFGGTPLG